MVAFLMFFKSKFRWAESGYSMAFFAGPFARARDELPLVKIAVAIGAGLEAKSLERFSRLMTFAAFNRGVRPYQRISRLGMVKLYLVDSGPAGRIMATFAILPKPVFMSVLMAVEAFFIAEPGKFDIGLTR